MGRLDKGGGLTCCGGKLSGGEKGQERRGEVMERAHSERSSVLDVLPDWLYLSTMR